MPSIHPRLAALATGGALAGVAAMQIARGPASAPAPLVEIGIWWLVHPPEELGRLVSALTLGLGVAIAVAGTRFLAAAGASVGAFVALSCASNATRSAGLASADFVESVALLLVFVGLAWLALGARASERPRRGLSPAWSALASIGVAAMAAAAVAPGRSGAAKAPHLDGPAPAEAAAGTSEVSIDLDMHPFVGRRLAETPVGAALPELAAELREGRAYLVFYNPQCGSCRGVFEEHFATPRVETVVAIEVPPAGADPSMPDEQGFDEQGFDYPCPSCRFESLPRGPNWIVASPMTLVVDDGVVTCVADRFAGDCLNPQE